eukprot:COSAG02_NODE_13327_length_1409_cov_73.025191_2_plen_97_part_01
MEPSPCGKLLRSITVTPIGAAKTQLVRGTSEMPLSFDLVDSFWPRSLFQMHTNDHLARLEGARFMGACAAVTNPRGSPSSPVLLVAQAAAEALHAPE